MNRVEQISLLNVRISTLYPANPVGQDIALQCVGDDGRFYYGKSDRNGRPIRATEWLATKLANHLGISVADCAVLESNTGETFFGSRSPISVASEHHLNHLLNSPAQNELGQPVPWLGQYLSQVWAFDLFVDNPDRNLRNFIFDQDGNTGRVRAIDFASARLIEFSVERFPVDSDITMRIGKFVRAKHGSHRNAAIEMVERIESIPQEVIQSILNEMPKGWLTEDQIGGIVEVWSNGDRSKRLSRLKALIEREWDA